MKCKLVVVIPWGKEEEGQSEERKKRAMPNRSRKKLRSGALSWVNEKKKKTRTISEPSPLQPRSPQRHSGGKLSSCGDNISWKLAFFHVVVVISLNPQSWRTWKVKYKYRFPFCVCSREFWFLTFVAGSGPDGSDELLILGATAVGCGDQ